MNPIAFELDSGLALVAVVGRGMQSRGTAGRIFSALAHAHVQMIINQDPVN